VILLILLISIDLETILSLRFSVIYFINYHSVKKVDVQLFIIEDII
jgi:hypothetical protein